MWSILTHYVVNMLREKNEISFSHGDLRLSEKSKVQNSMQKIVFTHIHICLFVNINTIFAEKALDNILHLFLTKTLSKLGI